LFNVVLLLPWRPELPLLARCSRHCSRSTKQCLSQANCRTEQWQASLVQFDNDIRSLGAEDGHPDCSRPRLLTLRHKHGTVCSWKSRDRACAVLGDNRTTSIASIGTWSTTLRSSFICRWVAHLSTSRFHGTGDKRRTIYWLLQVTFAIGGHHDHYSV